MRRLKSPPRETFALVVSHWQNHSYKTDHRRQTHGGAAVCKVNHTLQERFSLRLYCSSIFHSLMTVAASGNEVSSSTFCQTNEIVY